MDIADDATGEGYTALLQRAITAYGQDAQLDMLVEECAELIDAVMKRRRGRLESDRQLVWELADVQNMVGQARLMLDPDGKVFNEAMHFQLTRLQQKLDARGSLGGQ